MATARKHQIDLAATPYYHVMSRCVRRAYLSGQDDYSGKDYSHRKGWIVDRVKHLSGVFAIDICAYAVMSNHYHLVLHVNQPKADSLTPADILQRWSEIYPRDCEKIRRIISNSSEADKVELIERIRSKLISISDFMRCMNEIIAKLANKEDECSGKFWESRFKSQALLDEGAVLSAMAYVDLNPIRAKAALTPESSDYTSIQERLYWYSKYNKNRKISLPVINTLQNKKTSYNKNIDIKTSCESNVQSPDLMPFQQKNVTHTSTIDFKMEDYFKLVEETGKIIRGDKRGTIPENIMPLFDRLNLTPSGWVNMVKNLENNFLYAVGNIVNLKEFVPIYRKNNSKKISFVEECYQEIAA